MTFFALVVCALLCYTDGIFFNPLPVKEPPEPPAPAPKDENGIAIQDLYDKVMSFSDEFAFFPRCGDEITIEDYPPETGQIRKRFISDTSCRVTLQFEPFPTERIFLYLYMRRRPVFGSGIDETDCEHFVSVESGLSSEVHECIGMQIGAVLEVVSSPLTIELIGGSGSKELYAYFLEDNEYSAKETPKKTPQKPDPIVHRNTTSWSAGRNNTHGPAMSSTVNPDLMEGNSSNLGVFDSAHSIHGTWLVMACLLLCWAAWSFIYLGTAF